MASDTAAPFAKGLSRYRGAGRLRSSARRLTSFPRLAIVCKSPVSGVICLTYSLGVAGFRYRKSKWQTPASKRRLRGPAQVSLPCIVEYTDVSSQFVQLSEDGPFLAPKPSAKLLAGVRADPPWKIGIWTALSNT
jgi:hypothetical protein